MTRIDPRAYHTVRIDDLKVVLRMEPAARWVLDEIEHHAAKLADLDGLDPMAYALTLPYVVMHPPADVRGRAPWMDREIGKWIPRPPIAYPRYSGGPSIVGTPHESAAIATDQWETRADGERAQIYILKPDYS
jgi:hypothetical protein